MNSMNSIISKLKTYFWLKVYFFYMWLTYQHHKYNPNWHSWEWSEGIFDCGCCGFEGMYCKTCHQVVLIGHVGSSWPIIESGDIAENGY